VEEVEHGVDDVFKIFDLSVVLLLPCAVVAKNRAYVVARSETVAFWNRGCGGFEGVEKASEVEAGYRNRVRWVHQGK